MRVPNRLSLFVLDPGLGTKKSDNNLENIDILYKTEDTEDNRSSFDQVSIYSAKDGREFLNGLVDNKENLMGQLDIPEEEYDSLAYVALALASQETGMGYETGYEGENTGIGGFVRKFAKWVDVKTGGSSASSGLTQMKIYDFLNDSDKLTDKQKEVIKEYGITAEGVATNNLYKNPDKSAVATMVVLNSIKDKYPLYKNILEYEHELLDEKLGLTTKQDQINAQNKGTQVLSQIKDVFFNSNDEQKVQIRTTLKSWMLATNGTKVGDKEEDQYNEEVQLSKLNELLGENVKLQASDLDYIRYALTANGQEMSKIEYCAYAWNKGTGASGMQLDRMLAEKIGVMFQTPESFDQDQFTPNVAKLA